MHIEEAVRVRLDARALIEADGWRTRKIDTLHWEVLTLAETGCGRSMTDCEHNADGLDPEHSAGASGLRGEEGA